MRKRDDESNEFIFLDDSKDPPEIEEVVDSCATADCCDDDEVSPISVIVNTSSSKKSDKSELAMVDDDFFEAEIVTDGIHDFDWPITGMDCPDCAMKATSAINKNLAVTSSQISHAEGVVRVSVDLGKGDLYKVNHF